MFGRDDGPKKVPTLEHIGAVDLLDYVLGKYVPHSVAFVSGRFSGRFCVAWQERS